MRLNEHHWLARGLKELTILLEEAKLDMMNDDSPQDTPRTTSTWCSTINYYKLALLVSGSSINHHCYLIVQSRGACICWISGEFGSVQMLQSPAGLSFLGLKNLYHLNPAQCHCIPCKQHLSDMLCPCIKANVLRCKQHISKHHHACQGCTNHVVLLSNVSNKPEVVKLIDSYHDVFPKLQILLMMDH